MLLRHYWRREASALAGWSIALILVTLPSLLAVRSMLTGDALEQLTRLLDQLPPGLRSWMGGTVGQIAINTWVISLIFRTMAPLILTIYTALSSLSILTRDVDTGVMNFLLAMPLSRARLMLTRFLVLCVNLVLLHVALLASIGIGVVYLGYDPRWREYIWITANSCLVQIALASLMLVVTVFVNDYTRGLFIVTAVGLGLYFISIAVEPGTTASLLLRLSFFAYNRPNETMQFGAMNVNDALVLIASCAALVASAVWFLKRKQIPS